MLATPRNMDLLRKKDGEAISAKGVFAYSPNTGEEYSASPGDYWDAKPDEPLKDAAGEPMILCRRRSTIEVVA